MSKHTMTAYCPFGLQPDSIQVEIVYTYTPGSRATRIDPADPAEVDFVSARATLHTLDDTMAAMLDEWASEALSEDYWREKALDIATDDDR